jgi:hypothetical protein
MTEDDTFERLRRLPTEDEVQFGHKVWVYCDQHMRPHLTGWCTVSARNKIQLKATTDIEAYAECKERNLEIYKG